MTHTSNPNGTTGHSEGRELADVRESVVDDARPGGAHYKNDGQDDDMKPRCETEHSLSCCLWHNHLLASPLSFGFP